VGSLTDRLAVLALEYYLVSGPSDEDSWELTRCIVNVKLDLGWRGVAIVNVRAGKKVEVVKMAESLKLSGEFMWKII
jgi:hypothetical protein